MADPAGAAVIVEPSQRVDRARDRVVPPVELHEIERLDAKAGERSFDRSGHVGGGQAGEPAAIGDVLGVDLQIGRPAALADERRR